LVVFGASCEALRVGVFRIDSDQADRQKKTPTWTTIDVVRVPRGVPGPMRCSTAMAVLAACTCWTCNEAAAG